MRYYGGLRVENGGSAWRECELKEVAEVQTGPFGSQLKNEQYITGGTPVITVEHINNFRIDDFDYPSVTDEDKNRLAKYLLKAGDIIFTRVGSVDLSAFVKPHQDGWMFSSRMLRVRPIHEVDSRFLSYFFQQKRFREYILNISVGATMPSINTEILKGIPVAYPPLPEQKAIAEVLSALDDKIDLLHRQNKTLEQMAETLFRQWFVVEAGKDWEYEEILNYVSVVDNRGKTPPNTNNKTLFPLIEVNALGKDNRLVDYSVIRKYVDEDAFNSWFRNKPKKYDTLLSTVGSIGAISMYLLEEGNVAQNVIGLSAKNISPLYLFQALKYKSGEILQLDIGGVQPSIKVPHLLSLIIPIPPIAMQKTFDSQVIEFVSKMERNYKQIRTLQSLRDTLLPKLMSGEVRVTQ